MQVIFFVRPELGRYGFGSVVKNHLGAILLAQVKRSNSCILIVLNPFVNDSRVLKQALTLSRNGYSVTVFAKQASGLPDREVTDHYTVRRFNLWSRVFPRGKLFGAIRFLETLGRMTMMGVKAKPLVVHANDLMALPIGVSIARLSESALIYDSHEYWPGSRDASRLPRFLFTLMTALEKYLVQFADSTMTVCESIAIEMSHGLRIAKPTVIRNLPLSWTKASQDSELGPLRKSLQIKKDEFIILYQGDSGPMRGIDVLLKAFVDVHSNAVLVFLGAQEGIEAIRDQVRNLGLEKRVYFHPPVDPGILLKYTSDADIGVSPIQGKILSYRYCLPNKLFEYLQAGLPVVVSDLPEMSSIITRYDVGEIFPDGDSHALAKVLNSLLLDPARVASLKGAALKAAQELNWEREEKKFLAVYGNAVLKRHQKQGCQ